MSAKSDPPVPPLLLKPRTFSGQVLPKMTNQVVLMSPHDRLSTLQSERELRNLHIEVDNNDDDDRTPHDSPSSVKRDSLQLLNIV
jgi:hypothetical protein